MSVTLDPALKELAQRLCAATTSYQLGDRNVDYRLRELRNDPEPLGDFWYWLAGMVNKELAGT